MKTYECDRCKVHVRYSGDIRQVELSAPHLSSTHSNKWDICLDCRQEILVFIKSKDS